MPEDWATAELLGTYEPKVTSKSSLPGAKTLAIDGTGDSALVGGANGTAGVYSISQNKMVQSLGGEDGAVTDCLWWNNRAVIATATGKVKIFEGADELVSFNSHAGAATAVALHPCGEMLASVGEDKSYVYYDLSSYKAITQVYTDSGKQPQDHVRAGLWRRLTSR